MNLNETAFRRVHTLLADAASARIAVLRDETGARIIDCGVHVAGGIDAGIGLAEVCLAGLGRVTMGHGGIADWQGPTVHVVTDQPLLACIASQYAGWQIAGEKFFAMGSGPMRAARGREPILEQWQLGQAADQVVGVLESNKLPHEDVCHHVAHDCRVDPERLTLLIAPTRSLAGTIQVVARSIETTLHKLHEIGFDLRRVVSGVGAAPLPPVAATDLEGIGRTNDAILYGARVTLWVDCADDAIQQCGPRTPSAASHDHGRPFAEIFARYDHDFYRIDPLLFSPAVVSFCNLRTGRAFQFGQLRLDLLAG